MAIAWQPEATTTYSKAMNCLLHNHYINGDTGTCGKHQTKNQKFVVYQQGLQGAEIGTLGPVASIRLKIKNPWYANKGQGVQNLGH